MPATTQRERESEARILAAAEAMLAQHGEAGLQMKPLAERSGVAIATLYRYFPSKDHVLMGLAVHRYRAAHSRTASREFEGSTPGARAAELLVREFRAMQREPEITTAMQRATNSVDRSTSEYAEEVQRIVTQMVHAAAAQGTDGLSREQERILPIVVAAYNGAVMNWLCGIHSTEDVRKRIRTASRLLDLGPEALSSLLAD